MSYLTQMSVRQRADFRNAKYREACINLVIVANEGPDVVAKIKAVEQGMAAKGYLFQAECARVAVERIEAQA